jgi:hypothetical protein
MLLEALAAALVGVAALWLVLQPVIAPGRRVSPPAEPLDPEETPRGIALAALKEIDFDRETGKLSDGDYQYLKSKYTREALDALRGESGEAPAESSETAAAAQARSMGGSRVQSGCAVCGPRPEPDALYCSSCGRLLGRAPAADPVPLPGSTRTASA